MSVVRQTGGTVHKYHSCLVLFLHLNFDYVQVWYFIIAIVLVRNDERKMFNQSINFRGQLFMWYHYSDVIIGATSSLITSLTFVYSAVCSGADQRKHKSLASRAFVRGIHRSPANSPHQWPVSWKVFPFDDVVMSKRNYIPCCRICIKRYFALFKHYFFIRLSQEIICILIWISLKFAHEVAVKNTTMSYRRLAIIVIIVLCID